MEEPCFPKSVMESRVMACEVSMGMGGEYMGSTSITDAVIIMFIKQHTHRESPRKLAD